jgi:hypothetical protein
MKHKIQILTALSVALLWPVAGRAASFVVSPGQSLQTTINSAAAGDNITVQSGTYNENITITKGIDIRGSGGAALVTGTVTITSPALPVYIADLSFGKSGASDITINGTTSRNVRMDRVKLVGGGNLNCTNVTAYFYKCQFDGSVTFTGSTWTFQRTTVAGNLGSTNGTSKFIASQVNGQFTHAGASAGEVTMFQSTALEGADIALPAGKNGWIAYSSLRWLQISGGVVEVVGNWFDGRERGNFFLQLKGGAVTMVRNNRFWNDDRSGYNYYSSPSAIRVLGDASSTRIFNNNIRDITIGITVQDSPAGVEIRGNIHRNAPIENGSYSVITSYAGTIVSDNNFQYAVNGGVQTNNINVDPGFGTNDVLSATSASKDKGPSDALFNDIDGSRNDQGAYGGHSYDPTGRTTTKPVVLSGDVTPLYVKRGSAVTVKARAAVSAAP